MTKLILKIICLKENYHLLLLLTIGTKYILMTFKVHLSIHPSIHLTNWRSQLLTVSGLHLYLMALSLNLYDICISKYILTSYSYYNNYSNVQLTFLCNTMYSNLLNKAKTHFDFLWFLFIRCAFWSHSFMSFSYSTDW